MVMGRGYVGRFKEGKLKHRVLFLVLRTRLNGLKIGEFGCAAALPVLIYDRLWKWFKKEMVVTCGWKD